MATASIEACRNPLSRFWAPFTTVAFRPLWFCLFRLIPFFGLAAEVFLGLVNFEPRVFCLFIAITSVRLRLALSYYRQSCKLFAKKGISIFVDLVIGTFVSKSLTQ